MKMSVTGWVVLVCVVGVVLGNAPGSDRPDITMLYKENSKICVAGSNTNGYGLAFMSETLADNVYINNFEYRDVNGTTIDSSSDCDFELRSGNRCWQKWRSNNLVLGKAGSHPISPVTDERWNNFDVYRTNGRRGLIALQPTYDKSYNIAQNLFTGISIRSTQDAQILLCTGKKHPRSDACYWIIIDGSETHDNTFIRKCINGVPDKWATEDGCKIFRATITTPEKLLDESKWTHFMLSREDGNRIRLWLWDLNTGARPLLDYTDDDPLSLSTMYVRSYYALADWKVHEYQYANILSKRNHIKLGPAHTFSRLSSICVSLYVTLCSNCKLDIRLEREDGVVEMRTSIQGDSIGSFRTWRNVRLQGGVSNSSSPYYFLYAASSTTDGSDENTFWAIDDFRKCSNNEYRVLSTISPYNLLCQSLNHPNWQFNPNNQVKDNEPPFCSDGRYIGQHCNISCNSVIPYYGCSEQKICLSTQAENNKGACTCAAGYVWGPNDCTQQCNSGYYGYNCVNKCGRCKNAVTCYINTGKCPQGCEDDKYLPPYCQTIPNVIKYVNILATTDTTIVLSWKEPEEKNGIIQKYTVTYELTKRINCNGKPVPQNGTMSVSPSMISEVTISDLQPYSTYNITVAAETTLPATPLRFQANTTIMSYISEEELPDAISTSNLNARSVTIRWPVNCVKRRGPLYFQIVLKCVQDEWCDQIHEILLDNINSLNVGYTTKNLTPFTHYSVEMRAKRSQTGDLTTFNRTLEFYTPTGNPPAVRNATDYSKNKTTISVRWLDPYPPHGHLEKYAINYCYNTNSGCKTIEITTNQLAPCDLWNEHFNCYTLTDLYTNYQYTITITAKNRDIKLWSPDTILRVNTAEDTSSAPLNLTREWENNELKLSWNHPDITNGQLKKFVITMNKNKTEVKDQNAKSFYKWEYIVSEEMKTYSYKIDNVYQYSSSYIVRVCGVNSVYGENATLYIDTPPETPELAGDVTVDNQFTSESIVTIIVPGVIKKISYLYVVVSKINSIKKTNTYEGNDLKGKILNYSNYDDAWIAEEITDLNEKEVKIFLGSGKIINAHYLSKKIINKELEPSTDYELTLVLIDIYKNERSFNVYYKNIRTTSISHSGLYGLILLLLLPIAIYFLYRFIKKKRIEATYITPEIQPRNSYLEVTADNGNNSAFNKTEPEENIYETPTEIEDPERRTYAEVIEEHEYESIYGCGLPNPPTYTNLLAKEREYANL